MVDPLRSLLHASHLLAPDDLAATVAAHARSMGARETVIYLADYEQATLVPLPGAGVPERQELAIEATMAGRALCVTTHLHRQLLAVHLLKAGPGHAARLTMACG